MSKTRAGIHIAKGTPSEAETALGLRSDSERPRTAKLAAAEALRLENWETLAYLADFLADTTRYGGDDDARSEDDARGEDEAGGEASGDAGGEAAGPTSLTQLAVDRKEDLCSLAEDAPQLKPVSDQH